MKKLLLLCISLSIFIGTYAATPTKVSVTRTGNTLTIKEDPNSTKTLGVAMRAFNNANKDLSPTTGNGSSYDPYHRDYLATITTVNIIAPDGGGKIIADSDLSNLFWLKDYTGVRQYASSKYYYEFYYYRNLQTITGLENIDMSGVTNMTNMFKSCNNLLSIDISNWDISNVTNMSNMFWNCFALEFIDVSRWNTGKVSDMRNMFRECRKINNLNMSDWNTASVSFMDYMFHECALLETIDVSDWNTENVTNMQYMFSGCHSINNLDVSKWNTANVTNMQYMFHECNILVNPDVSGWKTDIVTTMEKMFYNCNAITILDMHGWNTENVVYMTSMFQNCTTLSTLDLSGWKTTNLSYMTDILSSTPMFDYVVVNEQLSKNLCDLIKPKNGTKDWVRVSDKEDFPTIPTSASGKSIAGTYVAGMFENMHFVTFNGNGATGGRMTEQMFSPTAANLKPNTFTRTGFSFLGWSYNPTDVTPTFFDEALFTATQDTTLFAIWENAQNITVSSGNTTIDDPSKTYKKITVYENASLTVNEDIVAEKLVLRNTTNSHFDLIQNGSFELSIDTIEILKIIDRLNYYFFSVPYDCAMSDVIAANPFLGTYGTNWLIETYSEETRASGIYDLSQTWRRILESETLKANRGYTIAISNNNPQNVIFRKLNATTSPIVEGAPIAVTASASGDPLDIGWNLISLPFYTKGSYTVSYTSTDGNSSSANLVVNTPVNHGVDGYLQLSSTAHFFSPTASFFVQVPKGGQVTVTKTAATSTPKAAASTNKFTLSIADNYGNITDNATLIHRTQSPKNEYEILHDVQKMTVYNKARIYFPDHNTQLAFSSINPDDYSQIALSVYVPSAGDYTIDLDDRTNNYVIYDALLDIESTSDQMSFTATAAGHITSRFFLHKSAQIPTDNNTTIEGTEIISSIEDGVRIEGITEGSHLTIYDTTGRILHSETVNNSSFQINGIAKGVYLIKINNRTMKCIVK